MCFATGIVSNVPIRPPRLKARVAVVFQDSTSDCVAIRLNPSAGGAVLASPAATVGMKALQLHQAISATIAIKVPRTVMLITTRHELQSLVRPVPT